MAERKRRINPNDKKEDGTEVEKGAIPGRPEGANEPVEKKGVELKEVFFQTPKGVMCKKIYECYRTKRGKYRKLVSVEKNVKG